MRKTLLTIVTVLAASALTLLNAKDFTNITKAPNSKGSFALEEGSFDVLTTGASVKLVLDFSNTQVVEFGKKEPAIAKNLGPIRDYFISKGENPDEKIAAMIADCMELGNVKIEKYLGLKVDEDNPQYEMKIIFDNLDFGSTAVMWTTLSSSAGGAIFSGNFIVTETATSEVKCNLKIEFLKTGGAAETHSSPYRRVKSTVCDGFLMRFLPKLIEKNK